MKSRAGRRPGSRCAQSRAPELDGKAPFASASSVLVRRKSALGQGRWSRAAVRGSALPQEADQPLLQSIISSVHNSRLVPATSFGSSAVHPPDLKLRSLLEFLASKRIPRVWDGSGREVTHETQNVDSAGGRLRRGTGGRNPLSCHFSTRTRTRTMSEYRDRG
jgi:hypothetical protein